MEREIWVKGKVITENDNGEILIEFPNTHVDGNYYFGPRADIEMRD